ncbi:MAG: hypothetical protein ACRER2_10010, partial [Methylococcales bacterium]
MVDWRGIPEHQEYNSHWTVQSTVAESIPLRLPKAGILIATALIIAVAALLSFGIPKLSGGFKAPLTWIGGVFRNTNSIADLIEVVKPAVVNISVSGKNPRPAPGDFPFDFPPGAPFQEFFRHQQQQGEDDSSEMAAPEFNALGSGFIISSDGYVVTNS